MAIQDFPPPQQAIELQPFVLKVLPLNQIDAHDAQPEHRADESRVRDLKESIEDYRICMPLEVARRGNRYILLNGHCRLACLLALGVTEHQCLILEDQSDEAQAILFFVLNCYTRLVNGNERIQAWANTDPEHREAVLNAMKPSQAKQIRDLIEIVGEDDAVELALEGKAIASIPKCVRAVHSWCDNWGHRPKPSGKKIARWVVKHEASRLIDSIARYATAKTTGAVVKALNENRAFTGHVR